MSDELVDIELLRSNVLDTAKRLAQEPGFGIVRPAVSSVLVHNVQAVSAFPQYDKSFELRCDESVGRGGRGEAPSPMRFLLSSIAFCTQVWCAKTASLLGVGLRSLQVDVRTQLDMRGEHLVGSGPAHPPWFVVDVTISSSGRDDAEVALVLDALRRCPVTSLVGCAVPVYVVVRTAGVVRYDSRPTELEPVEEGRG